MSFWEISNQSEASQKPCSLAQEYYTAMQYFTWFHPNLQWHKDKHTVNCTEDSDLSDSSNNSNSKKSESHKKPLDRITVHFSLAKEACTQSTTLSFIFFGGVESYWHDMDYVFLNETDSQIIILHWKCPLQTSKVLRNFLTTSKCCQQTVSTHRAQSQSMQYYRTTDQSISTNKAPGYNNCPNHFSG